MNRGMSRALNDPNIFWAPATDPHYNAVHLDKCWTKANCQLPLLFLSQWNCSYIIISWLGQGGRWGWTSIPFTPGFILSLAAAAFLGFLYYKLLLKFTKLFFSPDSHNFHNWEYTCSHLSARSHACHRLNTHHPPGFLVPCGLVLFSLLVDHLWGFSVMYTWKYRMIRKI